MVAMVVVTTTPDNRSKRGAVLALLLLLRRCKGLVSPGGPAGVRGKRKREKTKRYNARTQPSTRSGTRPHKCLVRG